MNDRMLYLKRQQRMIRSFRIMKGEHWKFKVRKSLREAKLKKFYKLIVKCSKKVFLNFTRSNLGYSKRKKKEEGFVGFGIKSIPFKELIDIENIRKN